MGIPSQGKSREEVFAALAELKKGDVDHGSGRTWAYYYDAGKEAEAIGKEAFMQFLSCNALDPTVYPSLLKLENDLVDMGVRHLGGGDAQTGAFTSGGTESIILALKTARNHARATRPEVTAPEVIIPESAHASFYKGCHYLGLKVVQTPISMETFKADVGAIKAAITDQTIMIVSSATPYAWGVVDPIEELGQVALDHDLLLHVDGCIGGFLLQYFRRLGQDVPAFDFTVPGVTSISMDWHKYAFTPKGASVVCYRSKDLRRHQYFACSGWTGYTVVNSTIQSTRSGGPMAGAWAVLNHFGDEGYLKLAQRMLDTKNALCEGIAKIEGLRLPVIPDMCLIPFTTEGDINIWHVIDNVNAKGWYVQPQLGYREAPGCAHLSIHTNHGPFVEPFLEDLEAAVREAAEMKPTGLGAAVDDAFKSLSPEQLTPEIFARLLGMAGISGTALPDRMAEINEVMNTLSPELSERLLIEYFNALYR